MTGDTATVLIGLGIITAVLPLGFLLLFRAERGIELLHPDRPVPRRQVTASQRSVPSQRPVAEAGIPAQAPATAVNEPSPRAKAGSGATG
jgi:hypothetical protein